MIRARRARGAARSAAGIALLLAVSLSSCAYYNTYYSARKYYDRATLGLPYSVDKPDPSAAQQFNKSIDYSKKLLADYPNNKWADDAYLLWGRALLGTDDPRQTIKLLESFSDVYPKSPLQNEATFYLGVAYRQARKYGEALRQMDAFLAKAPRHELAPYALLERSRILMSLDRPGEAAQAADQLLKQFSKSKLAGRAHVARAEARYAQGAFDLAREDFHEIGTHTLSDEDRLDYLFREADCLEGARKYDEELKLLNGAIAHERAPTPADSSGSAGAPTQAIGGSHAYGELRIRIGTVQLLSDHFDQGLAAYHEVILYYPHTDLAAEAQYRIGYAYETSKDDFDGARAEYAKVKEQGGGSNFVTQASSRLANLDRVAQFKSSAGDSVEKKAETGFLLAEVYLFQLDKPERALEEYKKVADDFSGTPMAAKALNAQGWVLSRKFKRPEAADSLFWKVVHEYPATESQLAARDYLEADGAVVPDSLIKYPPPKIVPVDTLAALTPPPDSSATLGAPPGGGLADPNAPNGMPAIPPDSLMKLGHPMNPALRFPPGLARPDSLARYRFAHRDSLYGRTPAGGNPSPSPRDTSHVTAPRDTSRTAAPPDTSHAIPPAPIVPKAPADTTHAPADTTRTPK